MTKIPQNEKLESRRLHPMTVEMLADARQQIPGSLPTLCNALKKSMVAGSNVETIRADLDAIAVFSLRHGSITFKGVEDDTHPNGGYYYMVPADKEKAS